MLLDISPLYKNTLQFLFANIPTPLQFCSIFEFFFLNFDDSKFVYIIELLIVLIVKHIFLKL
jgi:hypothetical protein